MSTNNRKRKNRNNLDFETKMRIYKQYQQHRPSIQSMTREWNISRSTVKRIIEDKTSFTENPKPKPCPNRRSAVCEVEKLVSLWIEDRLQRNLPILAKQIQTAAANLYNNMKRNNPSMYLDFQADDRWFEQYKLRARKSELKVSSEHISDTMSKGKRFPEELKALIEVGGYLPQQVFNVDRVLLFWRSMPDGTYITKKDEQISSDRVTLVLGCNGRGDFRLKPLVIHNTHYPSGGQNRLQTLPVSYRSSASSWLTMRILEQWFIKDFIPEVKEYCRQNRIPFKILLLLDSALRSRSQLIGLHSNVKVVYFPVNTCPLLQPLDQGIKSIFKAFYFSYTLTMVAGATQGDTDVMVQDFCEAYTIQMGISNITQAWEAIPKTILALAWKCLCPQFLDTTPATEVNALYPGIKRQIHCTASKLGFVLKMKDVESLIHWTGRDLTHNDLVALARLVDDREFSGQIDLTMDEDNNNSTANSTPCCTDNHINGQIDLTDSPIDVVDDDEVDDGRNLLTEYSPKHITSSEDEDDYSTDSEDRIIDCIKVEEPQLVEPTIFEAIPKDSIDEEVSDSESVILVNPPTQEDVTNTEGQLTNDDLPRASDIAEQIELAFGHITQAMEKFKSIDPNKARFEAVCSAVSDMLSCYKEMMDGATQTPPTDADIG